MGGLIGIHFAALPEIKKIVFINTPIYFWNVKIIFSDIAADIRNRQSEKIRYYKKSISKTSLKSGIDFLKILRKTKKIMSKIDKPALVLQCMDDESARFKSAHFICDKLGSRAQLRYYDGGCHQVFIKAPEIRDCMCGDIYSFIGNN